MMTGEESGAMPRRNLPALNDNNRFFWTSGSDGRLRICLCEACHWYVHPPAPVCPRCRSRAVAPQPVSGRGTVASFTVNRQAWEPGLERPYVVALVELDEQAGLRLTTNIVGAGTDAVYIGQRVGVVFEQREDVWLPLFRQLDGGDAETGL